MPYNLNDKLVIGVASSALFDLRESDAVFRNEGELAYRKYQEKNLKHALEPGHAFEFVRRLLSLNDLTPPPKDSFVEVVILSSNDPDTGLRVMNSVKHHKLGITRAVFMQGRSPIEYIPAFNMSLFLSGNEDHVRTAMERGFPAGQVLESTAFQDDSGDLRIAFDFDGVLADDESEQIAQHSGLAAFHEAESLKPGVAHQPGPLNKFAVEVSKLQKLEEARVKDEPDYRRRLHVSIVTARNAPSHERAIRSLQEWGIIVNDAFFLGGVEKRLVLEILRPHIFFDDQRAHLERAATAVPSVHVPFGLLNSRTPADSVDPQNDNVAQITGEQD